MQVLYALMFLSYWSLSNVNALYHTYFSYANEIFSMYCMGLAYHNVPILQYLYFNLHIYIKLPVSGYILRMILLGESTDTSLIPLCLQLL